MERTLRLYPWWCLLQSALFWQPVFVLWFSTHLEPADVLRLEAVYYGAVVLLEVPSGAMADRIGRRPLLIASSLAWALGAGALAVAASPAWLYLGQVLLALGMAFGSGADTALHADALFTAGRGDELGAREARARSFGLAGMAFAGAGGGLLGMLDLRAAYLASVASGLAATAVAWRLQEPPHPQPTPHGVAAWSAARDPVVRWVLAASVATVVLVHVPYELLQPWLALAAGPGWTPPLAGALVGVAMGIGALAASRADRVARSLGAAPTVALSVALQGAIVLVMALAHHPIWTAVVALRSIGFAVADPVLLATVHPRLHSGQRATWLSIQGLAGRLAFSGSLALVAVGAEGPWTRATLRAVALPYVGFAALAALGLLLFRPADLRPR